MSGSPFIFSELTLIAASSGGGAFFIFQFEKQNLTYSS